MSHRARRAVVVFSTLLSLSLPLAAAPPRLARAGGAASDFLAVLWSRLAAPLSALWANDSDNLPGTEGTPAPLPNSTPPPVTPDGRSVIDPLG